MILLSACGGEKSQQETGANEAPSAQQDASVQPAFTAQDLRSASLEGQMGRVKQAADQGIDVNAADQAGRTALMLASYNGHTEIVRFLLEEGANISDQNVEGRTPLMFAASGPFPETVELLLSQGADPDEADDIEDWTALMFAASEGHLEVVQTLIDHNADASLKDKDGETAVDFARNNNHGEVADLLENAME